MKPSKKRANAKHARTLAAKSPPLKLLKTEAHLLFPPPPPPPPHEVVIGIEEPMRANLAAAQRALGYAFHDPRLLEEALTHSSASSSHASYQRLEFVGDAALSLAITKHLYLNNPGLGPGELSSLRAANVSTEKLARAAVWHGLYQFVRHSAEEMDRLVDEFSRDVMREDDNIVGGLSYGGSSKKAPKVLADIIESVAAAVYIDSQFDLEMLWMVFRRILAPIITEETLDEQPVTSLYEHCQKHGKTVQFQNYCDKGKRNMVNIMKVFVDGELVGSGLSEQKHIAKINAARDALHHLWNSDDDDDDSEESEEEEQSCVLLPASALEEAGAKMRLNELCSKSHWAKPEYRIVKEQGPAHDKRFTCLVVVKTPNDNVEAVGDSKARIKDAENDAASRVLSKLCN